MCAGSVAKLLALAGQIHCRFARRRSTRRSRLPADLLIYGADLGFSTGQGSGFGPGHTGPITSGYPVVLRLSVFVVFGGFSQCNRQPEAFSHRRGGGDSPRCADNWSDGHQDPLRVFES